MRRRHGEQTAELKPLGRREKSSEVCFSQNPSKLLVGPLFGINLLAASYASLAIATMKLPAGQTSAKIASFCRRVASKFRFSGFLLTKLSESTAAFCFLATRHFRQRLRVGCDGFGDGLAIDKLPFAAAGDQPGVAQNLEVVRNGCRGHAAHRDDLAAIHMFGCRDGLKNLEASLVGQGFGYLLNLGMVHRSFKFSEISNPAAMDKSTRPKETPESLHPNSSIVI